MKLSQEQRQHFDENGYLIVKQALTDADLDPVINEYEAHINRRAQQLHKEGKLSQLHAEQDFATRLASICQENKEIYPELDIMRLRGKAAFEFLGNDNLLDLVEDFVGPEIICSPIQHLRPKLPTNLAVDGHPENTHIAPWHQDAGVTWAEADGYFILTVWVPLVDATPENGCLQIIPRIHGSGLKKHQTDALLGTSIIPEEMPDQKPLDLPMQKGDVLFMHKEIPHRSLPNLSDTVRWSMDLRYQKTGTPTGRPFHPEFTVRSRANPESVLTDHQEWSHRWETALQQSTGVHQHRWPVNEAAAN